MKHWLKKFLATKIVNFQAPKWFLNQIFISNPLPAKFAGNHRIDIETIVNTDSKITKIDRSNNKVYIQFETIRANLYNPGFLLFHLDNFTFYGDMAVSFNDLIFFPPSVSHNLNMTGKIPKFGNFNSEKMQEKVYLQVITQQKAISTSHIITTCDFYFEDQMIANGSHLRYTGHDWMQMYRKGLTYR